MSLTVQRCRACGAIQMPRRDICRNCLADVFEEHVTHGQGTVLARAVGHVSREAGVVTPVTIVTVLPVEGSQIIALASPRVLIGDNVAIRREEGALGPVFIAELCADDGELI